MAHYHVLRFYSLFRVPNKTPLCLDSCFRENNENPVVPAGGHPASSARGIDPVLLGVLSSSHLSPSVCGATSDTVLGRCQLLTFSNIPFLSLEGERQG